MIRLCHIISLYLHCRKVESILPFTLLGDLNGTEPWEPSDLCWEVPITTLLLFWIIWKNSSFFLVFANLISTLWKNFFLTPFWFRIFYWSITHPNECINHKCRTQWIFTNWGHRSNLHFKKQNFGTSLEGQRLRLHISNAGDTVSIPGQGIKILYAAWRSQKTNKKKTNIPEYHWFPRRPWVPPSRYYHLSTPTGNQYLDFNTINQFNMLYKWKKGKMLVSQLCPALCNPLKY